VGWPLTESVDDRRLNKETGTQDRIHVSKVTNGNEKECKFIFRRMTTLLIYCSALCLLLANTASTVICQLDVCDNILGRFV
jgi:hypothetical protein